MKNNFRNINIKLKNFLGCWRCLWPELTRVFWSSSYRWTRTQAGALQTQDCCCKASRRGVGVPSLCCALLSSSVMSDFVTPWTVAHQAPLSMGILQARILEWVSMPSSRGSTQPRDWAQVSCSTGGFFTAELPGKPRVLPASMQTATISWSQRPSEWLNNNWVILLYDSFKIYLLINFGCTGSSLLRGLFSSCGEHGAHFAVVHRLLIVLSCCGAQALRHEGFRVVACGLSSCTSWALEHRLNSCGIWLSCSVTCQSSWIRDQIHVSCIGRQILYHRATREAPSI